MWLIDAGTLHRGQGSLVDTQAGRRRSGGSWAEASQASGIACDLHIASQLM